MRTRTLLFAVRAYTVVLLYLQMALLLAMFGAPILPWGVVTVGPLEFVDQGVIFVPAVPGILGMYLVNARRRLEEHRLAEKPN